MYIFVDNSDHLHNLHHFQGIEHFVICRNLEWPFGSLKLISDWCMDQLVCGFLSVVTIMGSFLW